MAEAAATCLVEIASKLLINRADLNTGAQYELRQLIDDLNSLKDFLRVLAKKQRDEDSFREIERQIKEIVYDMEDTIDACLAGPAAQIARFIFPAAGPAQTFVLNLNFIIDAGLHEILPVLANFKMARKVNYLRKRKMVPLLETLRANTFTLAFADVPSTSKEELRTKQRKDHSISIEDFVGFEDEKETIICYLTEGTEQLDVISIIGMHGMGKTTLAWNIYNDRTIKSIFHTSFWIHVSKKFEIRDVCLNILKTLREEREDMSGRSSPELIRIVRQKLTNHRFLLIMDDICSVDDWKTLKYIFPYNTSSYSKVLITSCDNDVGKYASSNRNPHKLRFLNEDESWKLLQLEVFGNLRACPHELEEIGRIIAGKCDGLPLQLVAVGGLLEGKLRKLQALPLMEKEWQKVSENMKYLLQNEKSISDVVELTYSGLPADVSECFLYMGVFPENYEIPAWRLTRLWIAEGFIQPKQEQSLEETAMQNLDVLINKNLVMVDKVNAIGEVKKCRVHNMIRGFCINKAREQNLFQEMRMSREGVLEPPVSELHKFRRLCVHSHVHSHATAILSQVPNRQRVRSLLWFNESPTVLDDGFNMLKVLAIRFHELPRGVTKLFRLKYITLSVDDLNTLPKSLSKLWNLQTLEVDTKSHFITMKANIWKLNWLRHLKTNAAIILSSKGEGVGGENLQTLDRLSPESCTDDVCTRARNLKTLGIRGKLDTLFGNSFLGRLHGLEKLKLVNELFYEAASSKNALHELPQLNAFPPNLKWLTLSNTFLKWKHIKTLAKIKTLEVLKLKDNAFNGIYWSTKGDCFSSLQFLLIAETDLVHWEVSTDSFPSLTCLVLKKCENLNEVPWELAKNLVKLDIEYLGESAVESAKKIREQKTLDGESRFPFELSVRDGCSSSYEDNILSVEQLKHAYIDITKKSVVNLAGLSTFEANVLEE